MGMVTKQKKKKKAPVFALPSESSEEPSESDAGSGDDAPAARGGAGGSRVPLNAFSLLGGSDGGSDAESEADEGAPKLSSEVSKMSRFSTQDSL